VAALILVIEDNPQNLRLMIYLLESFGHTTVSALEGLSGLEAALRGTYDLVLSDIMMPGIDGYELARRFKADERLKAIPLIAVTALAMVGDRDRVLSAGFDGYISKPIDPQRFVSEVDAFLPQGLRSQRGQP
jgi:CheY-like chemotaxis protein